MSPQLFFIHLPKTAGTTFNAFLDQQYPLAEIAPPEVFDKGAAYAKAGDFEGRINYLKQFSLYRGHYGYRAYKHYAPNHITLVVLRDPFKRVVSLYNDWHSKSEESLENAIELERSLAKLAQRLPFKEFFQSEHPLVAQYFYNGQARPLAINFSCDLEEKELQSLAVEHLNRIDYVGITEAFDLFLWLICEQFGWHHPRKLHSLNKARHSLKLEDLDDDTLAMIAEKNTVDIALYNRAKELALTTANRIAKSSFPEKTYLDQRGQTSIVIKMADPIPGTGWYALEGMGSDRLWRWTGPTRETTLFIRLDPQAYSLSVRVISVIDPAILYQSEIWVNNTPIATTRHDQAEGFLLQGRVSQDMISDRVPMQLSLVVPRTMAATDVDPNVEDPRQKGLAVQEIMLIPVQDS